MKTYVFTVKHPGQGLPVREKIDLAGEYNLNAANDAIRAKFPESSNFCFQGVESTILEDIVANTRIQEPGYGPWN